MSKIWKRGDGLERAREMASRENILSCLGIEFTAIGDDYLEATMPVNDRTRQPFGLLHGGATCVLAETLGSVASLLVIDTDTQFAVGSVIGANHLRPVTEGAVTGTCRPVHIGRTKHVWQIKITGDKGKLIALCELTCAVTLKQELAG
jgi:1,4-dihydroxy-2-naphthoyl-CoA hydrolase